MIGYSLEELKELGCPPELCFQYYFCTKEEISRTINGGFMKCRKKPLEVEAFKWNGNLKDLLKWANTTPLRGSYTFEHKKGFFGKDVLLIKTNKGKMDAKLGDYIIKGIKNEFYPVKPDIFNSTYEIL